MRLLMLLGLLLLAGCLPPSQSQLRMEMDLEAMKRRLAQLETQQAETRLSGSSAGDSQQRQIAELLAGQDNLRVELQSINGRMDDMGQDNRQLVSDMQLVKDDLGLQLGSLTQRLDQLEQLTSDLGAQATAAKIAPVAPVEQSAAPTTQEPPTPEQQYQHGLDLIRKENRFAEGRAQLEDFARTYPEHELSVNALYWSGEALYGEKKYEMAILQLQDVISKHASHPKAAAAMFKQALAFNALGDRQNARTTMQKLIEDYPAAEQVESAKKFLAE